jgi:hypothetical protein
MNLLATGLLLVSTIPTIQTPRITLSDAELAAAYERGCATAQRAQDCPWLQRELEVRLLANLQQLTELGERIDRDVLQVAARADFPFLALFGLEQLENVADAEDEAAVTWALDHPSMAVRMKARQVAGRGGSARLAALLAWSAETGGASFDVNSIDGDDWRDAMMPEEARTLEELGLPEVAATYRPSMSDPALIVFTTAERPERVLAVLAKGKTTLSSDQMIERYGQSDTSEVEKIAKQMEGVTDQQTLMELMTKVGQATMEAMKPMATLRLSMHDPEGRYWEMPEGNGLPKRFVGVGRDETLGVTTIAVLLP